MVKIDADAHVLETEKTWEYMEGTDRKYRPQIVGCTDGSANDEYWLVDGTLRLKSRNVGKNTPMASRELRDVSVRLKHMDELGVDIQVIFPTIFIIPLTQRPDIELALCRSYNRWMADIWQQAKERLRWVAVLPLFSMDKIFEEAKSAKENGAVGIFLRGSECEKLLSDSYFYPLYDAASRLDLPICIHTGSSTRAFSEVFDLERNRQWSHSAFPPLHAFRDLVLNQIPDMFPKLRFGFLEASASWIPFLIHKLKRDNTRKWKTSWKSPADLFEDCRFYVACEADEDLNYLAQYTGAGHLLTGSDYGHNDPAEQNHLVKQMQSREDVTPGLIEKILTDNPKQFYKI